MGPPRPGPHRRCTRLIHRGAGGALALACLVAAGCTSAAPYRRLAEAGTAYADTVVALTGAAGRLAIDASSERLLQDDALANTSLATLERFDTADTERLAVLGRLAAHARLVGRYFALLGDLIEGRPGRRTVAALARVAAALDDAGTALRGAGAIGDTAPAKEAATLASGFLGRDLVRRELAARGDLLRRALDAHGEMLGALGRAMRHDLAVVAGARGQRLVVEPLLAGAPVGDADGWLQARRSLLTVDPELPELDEAVAAARALRDAVAEAEHQPPSLDLVEELVADVEAVRSVLAALREAGEDPS